MGKLRFTRDLFLTQSSSSGLYNENNQHFSSTVNVCRHFNTTSGIVRFDKEGEYLFSFSENDENISGITTHLTVVSGCLSDQYVRMYLNGVKFYDQFFPSNGPFTIISGTRVLTKSETKSFNLSEINLINRYKSVTPNYIDNDASTKRMIQLEVVNQSGGIYNINSGLNFRIRDIDINTVPNGYFNNSESNINPEIISIYPNRVICDEYVNSSGNRINSHNYIANPYNTPASDNSFLTFSGRVLGNPTTTTAFFQFQTSGYQSSFTDYIDRAVVNLRYRNNSSGTNLQDQSNLYFFDHYLDSPTKERTIPINFAWSSGINFDYSSGFTVRSADLCFLQSGVVSKYYATTDLFDKSFLAIDNIPSGVQISALQLDLYTKNDKSLFFSIPGNVVYQSGQKQNVRDSVFFHGQNRIKKTNYDQNLFDFGYFPFESGMLSNTLGDKSFSDFYFSSGTWSNYHTNPISGFTHTDYNNYLEMAPSGYLNLNNPTHQFSAFLSFSLKSNTTYGHLLQRVYDTTVPEFSSEAFTIYTKDGYLYIRLRADYVNYFSDQDFIIFTNTIPSSKNIQLFITYGVENQYTLNIYQYNLTEDFLFPNYRKVFSTQYYFNSYFFNSFYLGNTSGQNSDAYIHEFGLTNNFLSESQISGFLNSRKNLSQSFYSEQLRLEVKNQAKEVNEFFTLDFENPPELLEEFDSPNIFAHYSIPSKKSFNLEINYENYTDNLSGVNYNGSLNSFYSKNGIGENINLNFSTNFPSGTGTVLLESTDYVERLLKKTEQQGRTTLSSNLNIPFSNAKNTDFRINSIKILFDGWYLPPTSFNSLNFVENGFDINNSNLDFYLINSQSSEYVDFYMKSHETEFKPINFSSFSIINLNNNLDFNSLGNFYNFDLINFQTSGPLDIFTPINFSISGKPSIPYSSGISFTTYSLLSSGLFKDINFNTLSQFDPQSSINLFTQVNSNDENTINFTIQNDTVRSGYLDFYLNNARSGVLYNIDFSIPSIYNLSGNINLVL